MRSTRRRFLALTGVTLAAASGFLADLFRPFRPRTARADGGWSIRRASYDDLADLSGIFNAQLEARLFPFTDRIESWTEEKAARVLDTYTGTLVLEFNEQVTGFAAFIDYTRAETESSIIPEADPEVKIFALRVGALSREQRIIAVKHLALAVGRDLTRQGFRACEATIHARTGFQDLFSDHLEVKHVDRLDDLPEAKLVRFRIGEIINDLEAQGL